MLVKAWFANKTVVRTSKQEICNSEDNHTPSLQVTTEQRLVKVHAGLRGPDPGSTLVIQTNPYSTVPFDISLQSAD